MQTLVFFARMRQETVDKEELTFTLRIERLLHKPLLTVVNSLVADMDNAGLVSRVRRRYKGLANALEEVLGRCRC
jgi:hypothetical protein